MTAKKGDKVKVEYTGSFDDGTVFDSTERHGQLLEFEVGAGQVIRGFDNAIEGMEKGQEKKIRIEPKDAYGDRNPAMVKRIPREKFPKEKEPQKGMMLALVAPDGMQIPVRVEEVTDNEVVIDINHPLAGKTLNFKIKLIEAEEA